MSRQKPPKYSGDLAEPIYYEDYFPNAGLFGLGMSEEELAEYKDRQYQRFGKEQLRRFDLLFEHFEIEDKRDWKQLALKLSVAHVPGFQLSLKPTKKGRREKWSAELYCCLMGTVEHLKRQSGGRLNDSAACRELAKKKYQKAPWNDVGRQLSKRTLESRLSEARNPNQNRLIGLWPPPSPLGPDSVTGLIYQHFKPYIPSQ